MILILAFLSVLALGQLLLLLSIFRFMTAAKQEIQCQIFDFLAPQGDKPSKFAELTDSVAQVVAARMGTTVMAAIRGALGGVAKGVASEETQQALDGSPALSLVNSLAPGIAKKLGKNPLAMMALQGVLGKIMGGSTPVEQSSNHGKRKDFDFHG